MMNEFLGQLHFWPSLIFINGIFFPMFLQGMAGVHRRWYDGGEVLADEADVAEPVLHWNNFMSVSAFLLGARADSLHHQFLLEHFDRAKRSPTTIRGTPRPSSGTRPRRRRTAISSRHITSIAARTNTACPARTRTSRRRPSRPPATSRPRQLAPLTPAPAHFDSCKFLTTVTARPDTGLYNAKLGIWLFLASEVMLFGGLFSAYIFLRMGAERRLLAARPAERARRHDEHGDPHRLVRHRRARVGLAEDAEVRRTTSCGWASRSSAARSSSS